MILEFKQLRAIMPKARKTRLEEFLVYFNEYSGFAGLTNLYRLASFLSQIAHETKELIYMEEIASGKAYEGRKDLGNIKIGDGQRFKGRGPIQLTGRKNYRLFTLWIQKNMKAIWGDDIPKELPNFEQHPYLVSTMEWGLLAAIFYWTENKLNEASDKITINKDGIYNVEKPTRLINGGINGLEERTEYFTKSLTVLKDAQAA